VTDLSNPYVPSQSLNKGEGFVSQETLLGYCERAIKRHSHLSIVGGPGSGKTSLLREVRERVAEAGIRAAYLDCEDVESPEDFVQQVALQIGGQASASAAAESQPLPTDEGELFYFMEELEANIVVLLDNLCALPKKPAFTFDFWRTLRGIATDYRLSISFIATSCQFLRDCFPIDQACSDFWNVFEVASLPPPSAEAMDALQGKTQTG
jgi:Cdc6-like AAA superfamily ATPase